MMSAEKQVNYSGLPQEDWDSKPNYPKIVSNGPMTLDTPRKPLRNTGLIVFLVLTFITVTLSLLLVLGFHYYVPITNMLGYNTSKNGSDTIPSTAPNKSSLNISQKDSEQAASVTKLPHGLIVTDSLPIKEEPKDDMNIEVPKKEEPKDDKNIEVPIKEEPKDDKKIEVPIKEEPKDDKKIEVPIPDNPKQNVTPKEPVATIYHEFFEPIKTDKKPNETMTKPEMLQPLQTQNKTSNGGAIVLNPKPEINNGSSSNHSLEAGNNTGDDENSTESKIDDLETPFATFINKIASSYFNTTDLSKKDVQEWMESLLAKPSLQVIVIASGIIFAGLSLLVMGITCLVSKSNKVKRRRERINEAVSDLESNEKIILLTDDASEEEFVQA